MTERKQYLMNQSDARDLQGKVVKEIVRQQDRGMAKVRMEFTDGTAVSIELDRPGEGRIMVFIHRIEGK